jgi:hypothetical protein
MLDDIVVAEELITIVLAVVRELEDTVDNVDWGNFSPYFAENYVEVGYILPTSFFFALSRGLQDSASATDAIAVVPTKVLSDSASLSETQWFQVTKPLTDEVEGADSIILSHIKPFGDEIAASDVFQADTHKMLNENVENLDALTKSFATASAETLTWLDEYALTLSTALGAESITWQDTTLTRQFTRNTNESVSATDAGQALTQSYVEGPYFAQNYVGTLTTF